MTRIALDTNVLVSLLTDRDAEQLVQSERLLAKARCHIGAAVLIEFVWVTERVLKLSKDRIVDLLEKLVAARNVEIDRSVDVHRVIALYGDGFDFADALHVISAARARADGFATFDRDLTRLAGSRPVGLKVANPRDFTP